MNHKQTKLVHKLIYMALISRIIWRHKLIMLPFYGSIQKYMDPKIKESPRVLAYFAESVHDLVPDD
jgi:protein SDA1